MVNSLSSASMLPCLSSNLQILARWIKKNVWKLVFNYDQKEDKFPDVLVLTLGFPQESECQRTILLTFDLFNCL